MDSETALASSQVKCSFFIFLFFLGVSPVMANALNVCHYSPPQKRVVGTKRVLLCLR